MRLLALGAVAFLAACQTYDFEPVTPVLVGQTRERPVIANRRPKPNVMLLVDRSLSMLRPIEPNDPACPSGCGNSSANECPAACATRMSELKKAMGSFLERSGAVARFGVTAFPTNTLCQPADQINVRLAGAEDEDDESPLISGAGEVNAFVQSIRSMGGTPTGASLDYVGEFGGLDDDADYRDDFVLLLTDGLPNCNDVNPNGLCGCSANGNVCSAAQVASCGCTSNCVGTTLCALGCLDREGVVEKVKKLRAKHIRTIVVGFGSDLDTGEGPEVLNAMAREGGFAPSYFRAHDAAELSDAFTSILEFWERPCEFILSARPSDERSLSVSVEGQTVSAGPETYAYDFGSNRVTFQGATCERLEASNILRPVQVEFRIVERF
jgi:hypothetical protein